MTIPDASDPGRAAIVIFAAAWLNAHVAAMNTENTARERNGYAPGYGPESYFAAIEDAEVMAGCRETVTT